MKKTKNETLEDWKHGFWTFINPKYLKQVFLPTVFSFIFAMGFIILSFYWGNETKIKNEQWLVPIISFILITLSNIFIGLFISKVYENKLDGKTEKRGETNLLLLNSLLNNIIRTEYYFKKEIKDNKLKNALMKDFKSFEDNITNIMTTWKDVLPYSNINNSVFLLKNARNNIKNADGTTEIKKAEDVYENLKIKLKEWGIDSVIPYSGDTGTIIIKEN